MGEALQDSDEDIPQRSWDSEEWPFREYTHDMDWSVFQSDMGDSAMCVQASFLEFARFAEYERYRIVPAYDAIGIKAFFETSPAPPMPGEHIFLTNIFTNGKTITATLNADGIRRSDLKEGQEVTFPIEKLSDWFLVRNGRGLGGFTVSQVWSQLDDNEQKQYRDQEPFVWFQERGAMSASEELLALPKCMKCHKRLLDHVQDVSQPCGFCRSGSRRCNCPECGAPLIRKDKMSPLCARCA